jgi:hypothetical protein
VELTPEGKGMDHGKDTDAQPEEIRSREKQRTTGCCRVGVQVLADVVEPHGRDEAAIGALGDSVARPGAELDDG